MEVWWGIILTFVILGMSAIVSLWRRHVLCRWLSGGIRNPYCNDADFKASYEETSTTALSANPAVAVSLLTINGWILMQRTVTGGSVTFYQNWAAYRDGFGSATGNDNYWLGLDKVYRLMQMGGVRLRVEVLKFTLKLSP